MMPVREHQDVMGTTLSIDDAPPRTTLHPDSCPEPVILNDTNLWLNASLRQSPHPSGAKAWLEAVFNGEESIALPWPVVLAVLRIGTQRGPARRDGD